MLNKILSESESESDYVEYVSPGLYFRKDFKYLCHVNVE